MILPAFGVISEVLPVFARKPIFGYKAIAASSVGIAFLSMLVWAHHMFAHAAANVVLVFFMISSMAIAIPTGVKSSTGSRRCFAARSSPRRRCTSPPASWSCSRSAGSPA